MKSIATGPSLLAALLGVAALLTAAAPATSAPGFSYGSIEGKSDPCLACHSGNTVSDRFRIDPVKYAQTSHARIGCPACHDGIPAAHPQDRSRSATTACTDCHQDIAEEYARSKHAANTACGGCHNPHQVKAPQEISGQEMNRICSGCHKMDRMASQHSRWLPQADLHMEMLPCVTCHTASKNYLISLYIIKRQGGSRYGDFKLASYEELEKVAGGKGIRSLIDSNGDTYISLAELRLFNASQDSRMLRLQGVMIPEQVTHSFQILNSRWDCTFCHASGPKAMQHSILALPERNGTFTRIPVEQGAVLEALGSTPDFYMTGATRNSNLNMVGLAIIAGGLVMPVGHGFIRFLTRKNRQERSHRHE